MQFSGTRSTVAALGFLLLAGCESPRMTDTAFQDGARLAASKPPTTKADMITVGDAIFDDVNLSRGKNQSCASCHVGTFGYTGEVVDEVVDALSSNAVVGTFESIGQAFYEGSINGRFGHRKPPSAAYASYAPPLFFDKQEGTYRGGNFWDGRAKGGKGLTAIAAQGMGPFASGPEHAFGPACVLWEIAQPTTAYSAAFVAATGVSLAKLNFPAVWLAYEKALGMSAKSFPAACHDTSREDAEFDNVIGTLPASLSKTDLTAFEVAYQKVGEAIAAYEHSPLVNRFSARFDQATRTGWTADELAGEALFFNGSGCAACHSSIDPKQLATGAAKQPQLFTDYSYYNIGVPRNLDNPEGATWADPGLGAVVNDPTFIGSFKSPTLRNVDKRGVDGVVKRYMHNGVFGSLATVVHFYNTRDLKACPAGVDSKAFPSADDKPGDVANGICWPAPDFPQNRLVTTVIGGRGPVGNIGLTALEEQRLVAYLRTLSDGN